MVFGGTRRYTAAPVLFMYQFLFVGADPAVFSELTAGLPRSMSLQMIKKKDRLFDILGRDSFDGLVLYFPRGGPAPEDLGCLRSIVGRPRAPEVVVVADRISVSQAVCCMRCGAADCLTGPINGEILGLVLANIIRERREAEAMNGILGESAAMAGFRGRLMRYAETEHPVLIAGETGSGKDLAARTIHHLSGRRKGPFVPVNCASCSDEILSSELFGSRRGAFTGAVDRRGLFQSAQGGTIFLDEIGELSMKGQAKLLRVIEEKKVRPVGSHQLLPLDVRIVAATNRNLASSAASGMFRSDLYYRLNLLGITVPPLRGRSGDIPLLARHFLKSLAGPSKKIEPAAMSLLVKHDWPGNVRELHAVMVKASLESSGDTIRPGDVAFANALGGQAF